jgi:hypothetical protein
MKQAHSGQFASESSLFIQFLFIDLLKFMHVGLQHILLETFTVAAVLSYSHSFSSVSSVSQ